MSGLTHLAVRFAEGGTAALTPECCSLWAPLDGHRVPFEDQALARRRADAGARRAAGGEGRRRVQLGEAGLLLLFLGTHHVR